MNISIKRVFIAAFVFLAFATASYAQGSGHDRANTLMITFKDGHQKSFSTADLSRIEFDPPRIVLKSGRSESFSKDDIVRIEMKEADAGAAANGVLGRNHFVGKWKVGVGDGMRSHFYITLDRDGVAHKSMGSSHGTWELVNGEARITWNDGWKDIIRKVGEKHEKCAFAPGKSFDDQPSNVADAQNTTAQPI